MTLETLQEAIFIVLTWPIVGFLVLGLLVGIGVGATPGIGPALGMAILLPLTFPLNPTSALVFLVCIYLGGLYGGSISAIVLNVPGTAAAAATTFDGYPMTQAGRAKEALVTSAASSAFGGLLSTIIIIALSPFLVFFVLSFSTPDVFLMSLLGLAMITVVVRGSVVKGLVAGALGLLFTTVGLAPMSYDTRYTFGVPQLIDGFDFIAALLGLFAVAEMIRLASESDSSISGGSDITIEGKTSTGVRNLFTNPILVIKSSLLGLFIGSIPGAGSTVSNFVAYAEAVRSSTVPESFGKGEPNGVIASESSNSATVGGSLIPTLSFGIPGSSGAAVLLGALIMHGLVPGPELFSSDLDITYSLFISILIGNFIILAVGLVVIPYVGILATIDVNRIIPVIVVLAVLGGLALNFNWVDVYYLTFLGIIGYSMKKHNYSIIAFVLGAILGPITEETLWRSLLITDGSFAIFVSSPISIALLSLLILVLFAPVIKRVVQ